MKKFDQYVRHLRILSRAFDEDLTNDFIVSGIIDKYYIQFELGWCVAVIVRLHASFISSIVKLYSLFHLLIKSISDCIRLRPVIPSAFITA